MADRYQDRTFPAGDDFDRDAGSRAPGKTEGDPLAELARLIGQTDPFGSMGRANLPLQPHARPADPGPSYDNYETSPEPDEPAPSPPSWMQHSVRQEAPPPPPPPQDEYSNSVHPLHRYAAAPPPADDNYDPAHLFADSPHEPDLSRYDDALYGGFDSEAQKAQNEQAFGEDAYAY